MPAHVSLLHPFVGTAEFGERELEVSSELLSGKKLTRVDFVECYRRGDADGQDERPTTVIHSQRRSCQSNAIRENW
jgi:hypothetical protein